MHKGRKGGFSNIVHLLFVLGLELRSLTFFYKGKISRIYVEDVSCVEKLSVIIPCLSVLHGCITY